MQAREAGSPGGQPLLELRGVTRRYPGVVANDAIDLEIARGECHALFGENGAGKSTLVKIISGVVRPDAGEIRWDGAPAVIASPAVARRLGIGMVFQHFNLFETLTVAENVALGLGGVGDLARLAARLVEVSRRYDLPIEPHRHVHTLSVGERQRVEIVRCLVQQPRLLIMDEPTSVLTPQEVERLFATLRRLTAEGCAVLFISHKLDEIQSLCDRATVLRRGRVSAHCDPRRETTDGLARMMIGAELPPAVCRAGAAAPGAERLRLDHLSLPADDPFGTALRDVSLAVHGGEIVGVAGVAGNGQRELLAAIDGERRGADPARVQLDGLPVGHLGPAGRRARGLAVVPEERLGRGAVGEMSMGANALLTGYRHGLVARGFVRFREARRRAHAVIEQFRVACAGTEAEARSLSGGNLQKFIIGREMALEPRVLLLAHPTWGVDVGAAATIHQAIVALRDGGAAVLVISEDLEELFALADRIAVISAGRLSAARPAAELTVGEVGRVLGGAGAAGGCDALAA